jgi:hypothetical protein
MLRVAAITLVLITAAFAQPKPRIDFDALLKVYPDLPWEFEIRYVTKADRETSMLRIYYDLQADAVRWRPEYAGSLAQVCHATIPEGEIKKLLVLMRDNDFSGLPTENQGLIAVADRVQQIVSVRLGKTVVRKVDRGNLNSPELKRIEDTLAGLLDSIKPESGAQCRMESVPARP